MARRRRRARTRMRRRTGERRRRRRRRRARRAMDGGARWQPMQTERACEDARNNGHAHNFQADA
eukprot:1136782-Pyramimonas_sp.AAC.1